MPARTASALGVVLLVAIYDLKSMFITSVCGVCAIRCAASQIFWVVFACVERLIHTPAMDNENMIRTIVEGVVVMCSLCACVWLACAL